MTIEEQIRAALNSRAGQRPFVDELASDWAALANSFTALSSSAEDLAGAAGTARAADSEHAAVFSQLDRFLNGRADWQQRAAKVSGQLKECAEGVRVLHSRVSRETVNIGVLGVTGAGKSTLLRKLSGLNLEHIPSNPYSSSTATPSRIFHEWGAGRDRAILHLHTWDSFRKEVLVPLHQGAELSTPAPSSVEDFRRFNYNGVSVPEGRAGAERYLIRLRKAHDSLDSYADMLQRGGDEQITLDRLRDFVAYPPDADSRNRPYHGVRSVDIYCRFPEVGDVGLGLVDLPGSGEAGLDVHKRFLASLRNQTDLLFIVKRPSKSPASDQDWDAKQLADDAGAGVRLQDFAYQVINRDRSLPSAFYDEGVARARREGGGLAGEMLECDLEESVSDQVTEAVLTPVLKHLAVHLADMDHAAVVHVLTELTDVAAEVQSLAAELTRQIDSLKHQLPDEEVRHRDRVWKLRNAVGAQLQDVVRAYDELYESGEPIAELRQEITRAGAAVRDWVAAGLNENSTEEWLATYQRAVATAHEGHERDKTFNIARETIIEQFSNIDASLDLAILRLFGEVAAALREKLTEKIVPTGPDNRAVLLEFAETSSTDGAPTLSDETIRLLGLKADYGNIFLRVGRPIVRKVTWADEASPAGIAAAAVGDATAATPLPESPAGEEADAPWWLDDVGAGLAGPAGPVVQAAATELVSAVSTQAAASDPAAQKYPEAARWHRNLTARIEDVTKRLEAGFLKEAQETLTILAAAVDRYRDSVTTAKGTEVEYERVSNRAQREIWPEVFSDDAAEVTTEMAALRQEAAGAEAAAKQVVTLVDQARRLSRP